MIGWAVDHSEHGTVLDVVWDSALRQVLQVNAKSAGM